jgi:hypothetical protein
MLNEYSNLHARDEPHGWSEFKEETIGLFYWDGWRARIHFITA